MSALGKVNYSSSAMRKQPDLTGHVLLTFTDRGVDNDVPFVSSERNMGNRYCLA